MKMNVVSWMGANDMLREVYGIEAGLQEVSDEDLIGLANQFDILIRHARPVRAPRVKKGQPRGYKPSEEPPTLFLDEQGGGCRTR